MTPPSISVLGPLAQRVVVKDSGCWEWAGPFLGRGYGSVWDGRRQQRTGAHRVAYEVAIGPIPDGMWVLHHCDNPPCVNPAHLFLGTHRDNMADMRAKGRGRFVNTWRPGEENRNARLSADQVVAIRRAYSVGEKQRDLAVRFGVSKSLVALITAGHIWKHIPTERPIAPRRAPGRRRRDRYVAATARSA